MHSPAITRLPFKRAIAAYFVLSLAILLAFATNANAANPITINFDDQFYSGTIITNQYPGAVFSGMGFSGGVGTQPQDYNIRVSNARYRSYPNSIISANSYNAFGWVYVNFPVPVSNLSFYALNIYQSYYAAGYIYIRTELITGHSISQAMEIPTHLY